MVGQYEQSLCHSTYLPASYRKDFKGNPKLGGNSLFTPGQEKSIATHVNRLAKMFHGVNPV